MEAFEVLVNGHRFCLAGVADGVMTVFVNCIGGPDRGRHMDLRVGGLDRASGEHPLWAALPLGVGAEVLVRVVEAAAVDPPDERRRVERPTKLQQYREDLRELSDDLTEDERRQLLRELVADLERGPAPPEDAEAPG